MKTDAQLRKDVEAELEWDHSVNATHVGVAVKDGVVTLSGHLETYAEKAAVERAAQRVGGIRGLAVELDVKLAPGHVRSDSEIALAAQSALSWHALLPAERIRIKVEGGWVTLGGEVDWDHQRRNAEKTVRTLTGVVGVTNGITLKPHAMPANIGSRIREALSRQAAREAQGIEISVDGDTVTLKGTVHSWAERRAAIGAAFSAPGVTRVVNDLRIGL
jgi:osmotically-inducible protein OsmY